MGETELLLNSLLTMIKYCDLKKCISQNIHCGRLGNPRPGHERIYGKLQMISNIANRYMSYEIAVILTRYCKK